jgi:hypothetical protein
MYILSPREFAGPGKNSPNPKIGNDLYSDFQSLLAATTLKEELNMALKKNKNFQVDLGLILGTLIKPSSSEEYKQLVLTTLERDVKVIKRSGVFLFEFKQKSIGPRLFPKNTRAFNSVRKALRSRVFELLSSLKENYVVLDIDLKQCYLGLILGLFPQETLNIRNAFGQSGGMWQYLENEFKEMGYESIYNKRLVKVCVYASLFQGGHKALLNGC